MAADIHKATGVLIRNRKLLVVRAYEDEMFISVGGKVEPDETVLEALHRECYEELGIQTEDKSVEWLETIHTTAVGRHTGKSLQLDVFLIHAYIGTIKKKSEITELAWVNSHDLDTVNLAPALKISIIPSLANRGLID